MASSHWRSPNAPCSEGPWRTQDERGPPKAKAVANFPRPKSEGTPFRVLRKMAALRRESQNLSRNPCDTCDTYGFMIKISMLSVIKGFVTPCDTGDSSGEMSSRNARERESLF